MMKNLDHIQGFQMDLGGPLDALSMAPDGQSLAVGGREVFKILTIDSDKFIERINLKKGRHNLLNKTVVDIKWHYKRLNTIASAPTSGSVVIWDLLTDQGCMVKIYGEHTRTVNKLSWKPNDENLLLSASQDGFVKLWDIRNDSSCLTFDIKSEVRQVKWSPFYHHLFATGSETGIIDIWDVRKNDVVFRTLRSAHVGVIHALDWHPKSQNLLASGSRDTMIKCWDLSNQKDVPKTGIQTIATLGCISWRPGTSNQIASSSTVIDNDVNIWSVEDPFIPVCTIEHHQDVVTDMMWVTPEGDHLLTCSKDSTLKLHKIDQHPNRGKNRTTSLSWNPRDQFAFIPSVDKMERKQSIVMSPTKLPMSIASHKHGEIRICEEKDNDYSTRVRFYAKNLKIFDNLAIEEKCVRNAEICSEIGHEEMKLAWLVLSALDLPDDVDVVVATEPEKGLQSPVESVSPRSMDSPMLRKAPKENFATTPKKFQFEMPDNAINLQSILNDILDHLSETCDAQNAFAVGWIFGSKLRESGKRMQEWQLLYIEQLTRMNEFILAAEVRKATFTASKHSPLITCCGTCGKGFTGSRCISCKVEGHICVICRLPCKGAYLWLNKCGHGGHVEHMMYWMKNHSFCPSCSLPLSKAMI